MLTALLVVLGFLGLGFAAVVYRADSRRLDNRLFALIAVIDSVTSFTRAVFVWHGYSLADIAVLKSVMALSAMIAAVTIEFAYAFPGNRPLPPGARWLNLALAALVVVFGAVSSISQRWVCEVYFLPAFATTLYFLWRNFRRVAGGPNATAVKFVIVALSLRWTTAHIAYDLARFFDPNVYLVALTCEATAAVLASQVLIGYAVVVGHLFRVRGFLAEVLVLGAFALTVSAATGAAIEGALAFAPGPFSLRLLLFAAAFVPLGLARVARQFRARLENAILVPLDPRRAARESCLEAYTVKAERADVPTLLGLARSTLAEMANGGTVRFLAARGRVVEGADGVLDDTLAAALAPPERWSLPLGDGRLVAPVRVAGELGGALVVRGGDIDHDTVIAAMTIAKHLGLRLENFTLVAELEESRRLAALGGFAAAIAHDIRTPLTSVQMNVQILRGKVSLPPDDMEHFDIALGELKRLNVHIAQLLDYAKPVRLDVAPASARAIAEEAARTVASLGAVPVDVVGDDSALVAADPARLRQILLNLLDNAMKASATRVVVRVAARDGRVVLSVTDDGKGIPPGDLARIFEPFFTTRPDGTGLGLAIVHKLVRAHGGEVEVASTPGQGTVVTVLVPRHGS